jgi:hypothetical protein
MSLTLHSVVGTIHITPNSIDCDLAASDDSALALLLASLAHRRSLDDDEEKAGMPVRLVAARRLRWFAAGDQIVVRANVSQLIEELQDQFDELGGAASGSCAVVA